MHPIHAKAMNGFYAPFYKMENSKNNFYKKQSNKELLKTLTVEDASHLLLCKHCIGLRCSEYTMRCKFIEKTNSGKCKIVVFGERDWRDKEHIKRIRYVNKDRLIPLIKKHPPAIKTIEYDRGIEFYFSTNNKFLGVARKSEDGYYYFEFDGCVSGGGYSDYLLILIGEKLKELNKEWDEQVKSINL